MLPRKPSGSSDQVRLSSDTLASLQYCRLSQFLVSILAPTIQKRPLSPVYYGSNYGSEARDVPSVIQRGFPILPPPGGDTQFQLLREWIKTCNDEHRCFVQKNGRLPTRLLDVGDQDHPNILRLDCANKRSSWKYMALSHRWGDPRIQRPFYTCLSNINAFQESIDLEELPQTFKDAVIVTRKLGVRYLWIDSLCIIQGDPDDWRAEAKRMEDVFNFAYCTIAATSANGSDDGFIKPRASRRCVPVQKQGKSLFYICEAIDDFRSDVELGDLNKRGWVFQERALSHRTIYFSGAQVYWECGKGVHCETLTKMSK